LLRREGKGLLGVFSGVGVRQSVCSKDDEVAQPRSGVKKIAHGASRGIAVKSAISPGRGVRMGDQTAFFFRRYAAFPVRTALPTAGAVGYFLPLLRSYSFGHPRKTSKKRKRPGGHTGRATADGVGLPIRGIGTPLGFSGTLQVFQAGLKRTNSVLVEAVGLFRWLRLEERLKSRLLEVRVESQSTAEVPLAHKLKGYAIGQRPFLVVTLAMKLQA